MSAVVDESRIATKFSSTAARAWYGPDREEPIVVDLTGASDDPRRAHHDLGGVPKFLCRDIDTEPHTLNDFDRQVDALRQLLALKGIMTVDELRRGIEEIPEAEYHRLSYYQRWIRSMTSILLRKGVLAEAELAGRLAGEGA